MNYNKEYVKSIDRYVYFNKKSMYVHPDDEGILNFVKQLQLGPNTVIVLNYNPTIIKQYTNLHELQYLVNIKLDEIGFKCIDLIIQENISLADNSIISKILKKSGIIITKCAKINNMISSKHNDWYCHKQILATFKPIKINRVLTAEMPQLKYKRTEKTVKYSTHWGQRKLLLTEIEFLTKYFNMIDNIIDVTVVYAGSAPGTHILYLSKLFPSVQFELYDQREFSNALDGCDKINTHVQYFTDDTAKLWSSKDKPILFISDIRTGDHLTMSSNEVEHRVSSDHKWQMNWYNIIKPDYTMFKFRLPWACGKTNYLDGDIYIQPYPPATSTETRLIIGPNAHMKEYDNILYENQLFYHNSHTRNYTHDNPLIHIDDKDKNFLSNNFDGASEVYILQQYLNLKCETLCKTDEIIFMSKQIDNYLSHSKKLTTEHTLSEKKISVIKKLKKDGFIPTNAQPTHSTFNTFIIPQYNKYKKLGYII